MPNFIAISLRGAFPQILASPLTLPMGLNSVALLPLPVMICQYICSRRSRICNYTIHWQIILWLNTPSDDCSNRSAKRPNNNHDLFAMIFSTYASQGAAECEIAPLVGSEPYRAIIGQCTTKPTHGKTASFCDRLQHRVVHIRQYVVLRPAFCPSQRIQA